MGEVSGKWAKHFGAKWKLGKVTKTKWINVSREKDFAPWAAILRGTLFHDTDLKDG